MSCDDCVKGVRHEGEPEGNIQQIGGVECYVSTPAGDYPKDKVVLFLSDVFGIPLVNNKAGWRDGPDSWKPVLDAVVASLRAEGVTWIGTTGYCSGAPPAWYLALKGDSKEYRDKAKAPLLINSCETDPAFPQEAQAKADEILGGGKFAPGYERTYWEGCNHGFAVRGDMSNPKIKAGKEGAFDATVKFFKKYQDL
ncbi:hypothetical protein BV20DRAFT_1053402 [Pilatotrama ljubarskyi]|nr:hypothetical protein BV20DRAFT_1053402 [Pilatotrama ljubarskyi]